MNKPKIDPNYMINYNDNFYINLDAHNLEVEQLKSELKAAQKKTEESEPSASNNTAMFQLLCPKCGSHVIHLSILDNDYWCDDCHHRWKK